MKTPKRNRASHPTVPAIATRPPRSRVRPARSPWNGAPDAGRPCRIATYSPGMVGFGHIRRNASIAQALTSSVLHPAIMMIAEAWQAGTLPMPPGVDCVTLPGLRKNEEGGVASRSIDVSNGDLVALRSRVILGAMEAFDPDVLIVDHLPLGAARELTDTLAFLRERGKARCILGLRDVLQDRATVHRTWSDPAHKEAVRRHYDAIWVYSDPAVYDLVQEHKVFNGLASRVRFTGYLDQRPRLALAADRAETLLASLPHGPLTVCLVGGGVDGAELAATFIEADLPPDHHGIIVTGPFMPDEARHALNELVRGRPRLQLIDFLAEPIPLVARADRVIAMGGYNSVCEVLSFEKHALIVPRMGESSDQWIRAQRMRDLGLLEILEPDRLSPAALSEWLARDLGPPPASRSRVDLNGLGRIPQMMLELIGSSDHLPANGNGLSAHPWSAP